MESILKGTIYITSSIDVIYNYPIGVQNKVINLDEDGLLQEDDQNIIGGSCLLPPMLAKIAESDGNEYDYEMLSKDHLLNSYQQSFVAALIAALYRGKNLLLFLPELGYSFTRDSLCKYMYQLYGLNIGIMEVDEKMGPFIKVPCFYDPSATPIWLNLIYEARVISPQEYLINYPIDADIRSNSKIMNILMSDLKPYGKTINEKIDEVVRYHKQLHKNPNARLVIHSLI